MATILLLAFISLYLTSNIEAVDHVAFNKVSYIINCSTVENTTINSPYRNQLKMLMGSLHSKNTTFFKITIPGIDKNDTTLYALFMCRGDIDFHMCNQCKNGAVNKLSSLCPISKVGLIRYQICLLRYSNRNFFSTIDSKPFSVTCVNKTAELNSMSFVNSTLYKVANKAATGSFIGGKQLRFATNEVRVSNTTTLFTLAQCTLDLNLKNCKSCLENAILDFLVYGCYAKDYAEVFYTSCFIGYSTYNFYLPLHDSPPNDLVPQTNVAIQDSRSSQDPVYLSHDCNTNHTHPISSKNLKFLLSGLTYKANAGRSSYREHSIEKGYAQFLCRGDLTAFYCAQCIKAAKTIIRSCAPTSECVVWFSQCVVKFSSYDIYTDYYRLDKVSVPSYKQLNITKFSMKSTYAKAIMHHLDKLQMDTSDSERRYMTDTMKLNDLQTIYFLAQCMGDMSTTECNVCLGQLVYYHIPVEFLGSLGGTVLFSSCILRFELYPFYMEGDKAVLHGSHSPGDRAKRITILSVFSLLGLGMLLTICLYILVRRRRTLSSPPLSDDTALREISHSPSDHMVSIPPPLAQIPSGLPSRVAPPSLSQPSIPSGGRPSGGKLLPPSSSSIAFGSSKSTFSYEEFMDATDRFSDANYLGKGGFGSVHKGILPDGKEVAVKQLKAGSSQGESEFKAEVEIISRIHHKHLVSLVGYCSTGYEMLLAYEFVPNKTLEFHLHGKALTILDWSARQLIAVGSAKGLAYLHEDCHPKIIHRDIKSANILLDFNFEAKVCDFGLAKDAPGSSSHVSTQVKGTFGYLDPEYAGSGQLTDKSDVFSYGVVLLELITGRLPIDKSNPDMHVSLVEWARPFLMRALKGKNSLVDPRLQNEFDRNEMTRMVACAEACTRQSAKDRPKMSEVVRVLEGAVSIADLKARVTPGHSSQQHKEDMTKWKKIAIDIKGKWK